MLGTNKICKTFQYNLMKNKKWQTIWLKYRGIKAADCFPLSSQTHQLAAKNNQLASFMKKR